MRAYHLFRALTPHWERRHLAGVFDSVHAGKMPALPVLRKKARCTRRWPTAANSLSLFHPIC